MSERWRMTMRLAEAFPCYVSSELTGIERLNRCRCRMSNALTSRGS